MMKGKRMQTIFEAKKHCAARYLSEEGFVGVGIGLHENTDALRVYVESADCAIAQQFKDDPTYEGFPVIVEVTGKARALPA